MTLPNSAKEVGSILALLLILVGSVLAFAAAENNFEMDNNFLSGVYESTHVESGYRARVIVNPSTTGIYARERRYKLDLTINPQGVGGRLVEDNYKLDLIPEKAFPDIPSIAITSVVGSKTIVGQGYALLVSVTISNQAFYQETFYVVIRANATAIGTQAVTLTGTGSTVVTYAWNTTGFAKDTYIISIFIPVPGETVTIDNTYVDGAVLVSIAGDLDGDRSVNVFDLYALGRTYGSTPTSPNWDPNADINNDVVVNSRDLRIQSQNYGKTDP